MPKCTTNNTRGGLIDNERIDFRSAEVASRAKKNLPQYYPPDRRKSVVVGPTPNQNNLNKIKTAAT